MTGFRLCSFGAFLLFVFLMNNSPVNSETVEDTSEEDLDTVLDEAIVTLPGLGALRGGRGVARNKEKFSKFLGVPYAAPPTGDRRFSQPEPVQPWKGVKEATSHQQHCMQKHFGKILGSEDCLYVNIFTKHLNTSTNSPVIFYVHGGAFIFGGTQLLGPEYILEEDVVLVTVQYRLNAFGFLSTEDSESPGNYGLQDQLAALKWLHQHIKHFGGDPAKVTLMGLSAGGASVHYLLLSNQSRGLFQRAVAFSGSALCWWANLPNHATTAKKLAGELGCPISSSISMLKCLRGLSSMDLMTAQSKLYSGNQDKMEQEPMNVWSPRPDPEAGPLAILPVTPIDAIQEGMSKDVPVIFMLAEAEGIWRGFHYAVQPQVLQEFLHDFEAVAPLAAGLQDDVTPGTLQDILQTLKGKYLNNPPEEKSDGINRKDASGVIDLLGDSMFYLPVLATVEQHSATSSSPVWLFLLSYQHSHSLAALNAIREDLGSFQQLDPLLRRATHANELSLMFPHFLHLLGPLSAEETQVSRRFIRLLMEFVNDGVPNNRDWKDVARNEFNFLDFGLVDQVHEGLPMQDRLKYWVDLPVYWKKKSNPSVSKERMQTEL